VFNPIELVIDAFVDNLRENYLRTYGVLEPEFPNIIGFIGRMALENIANSDAPYHDVFHTISVAEVGQEILKGKHVSEGGVSPRDWLHFAISLVCHDIGYVRGVCRGDREGEYITGNDEEAFHPAAGATDAAMLPYHVNRSKIFVRERFGHVKLIDCDTICENIEHTRFPVPERESYQSTDTFPGLVRAADLIGQMGDISYLRKVGALYSEFRETGLAERLGYTSPADVRAAYPKFFWNAVSPYIKDALEFLRVTQEGKLWIASLYAHVFVEEHHSRALGPERKSDDSP
jgi:hypothetical protein